METIKLYNQLEDDFITSSMSDKWAEYMEDIADFLTEEFKKRFDPTVRCFYFKPYHASSKKNIVLKK